MGHLWKQNVSCGATFESKCFLWGHMWKQMFLIYVGPTKQTIIINKVLAPDDRKIKYIYSKNLLHTHANN